MKRATLAALALALTCSVASAEGTYVSGFGGANFASDFGTSFGPASLNSNTDTGYVIGAAVGTWVSGVKGLRIEGEVAYRSNDLGLALTVGAPPPVITLPGSDETWSFMGNLAYDIPVGNFPLKPYVLGGVGYADRTISVNTPFLLTYEANEAGIAWQLGAGAHYALSDTVAAHIGYRYFQGPDISRSFGPVGVSADGNDSSVIAGLTFRL